MGIKIFGKNIAQVYSHHIMEIEYGTVCEKVQSISPNSLRKIDPNKIEDELKPVGTTVTIPNLKRLMSSNIDLVEGFVFGETGGCSVGTIWVMYKGGNDLEYRIRNIDAYIFDVYVNEKYRGKGFAGEMICQLMDYLHEKGIDSAQLAVSMTNKSAIRAYEKTGFVSMADKRFARVLKINIPYHEL